MRQTYIMILDVQAYPWAGHGEPLFLFLLACR